MLPEFISSFTLVAVTVAVIAVWILNRFHSYETQVNRRATEGRHAFEALGQLHALATRVAVDVPLARRESGTTRCRDPGTWLGFGRRQGPEAAVGCRAGNTDDGTR